MHVKLLIAGIEIIYYLKILGMDPEIQKSTTQGKLVSWIFFYFFFQSHFEIVKKRNLLKLGR